MEPKYTLHREPAVVKWTYMAAHTQKNFCCINIHIKNYAEKPCKSFFTGSWSMINIYISYVFWGGKIKTEIYTEISFIGVHLSAAAKLFAPYEIFLSSIIPLGCQSKKVSYMVLIRHRCVVKHISSKPLNSSVSHHTWPNIEAGEGGIYFYF